MIDSVIQSSFSLLGIFGIGMTEMLVVGAVVLLLFGNRLPSTMRSLGRSLVEFKKGAQEGNEEDAHGELPGKANEDETAQRR
jgi:sec-independent protein translocase protein TatA